MITPAISVMSAMGVKLSPHQLDTWIVPISIIVLTLLFVIQKHGTGMVGKLFAPIMLIWFLLLAVLNARSIYANPEKFCKALNPYWAVHFFLQDRFPLLRLARWCCRLPGWKRCTPIWATSANTPIHVTPVLRRAALVGAELFAARGRATAEAPEAIKNPFFLLAPGGR
ncbi:KUP/HAK/KT family potassium transporter [Klebsiella pneumoniae]|nr:KUP/HAK/KT family potassium transporter [Klebsiella pneumoniae]